MKKDQKAVNLKTTKPVASTDDLLLDLQRTRADFENYRKNVESRVTGARGDGQAEMAKKLLPIIDDIERATAYAPEELADNEWVKGVVSLNKKMQVALSEVGIEKINAAAGTKFDPAYHDAVQFNESADGETEVIESELQPGYVINGEPIRHAMVRVTKA